MSKPNDIRVAIVEDDQGLRQTLETLLGRLSGVQCVGAYPNGESALEGIPECAPAVVLMDIHLPGMNGVECATQGTAAWNTDHHADGARPHTFGV